jgi:hypothetical protein
VVRATEEQADLLLRSYKHWTGKELVEPLATPSATYEALYQAPFALASHDTADDPMFNYGNLTAQKLFEMDWNTLISHPSRHSAEPVNRAERARLLERVTEHGYIDDYRGIRISSTGRRFQIEEAFIWNLIDSEGVYWGQAAALYKWTDL